MKLLNLKSQKSNDPAKIYGDLIRQEAKIGGQIFGEVKPGNRREFFCLDPRTWIWHEEWVDPHTGKRHIITTRYDVRPSGVLKAQDGQTYRYLDSTEAKHFLQAVRTYIYRVKGELYQTT